MDFRNILWDAFKQTAIGATINTIGRLCTQPEKELKRTASEVMRNIPNSINVPYNFLIMNPENYLDKSKKYYLYCGYGSKSRSACEKLSLKGYDVVNILEGYNGYLLFIHKK